MAVYTRNSLVRDGLILHLDAANPMSYTSGSSVWNDLSGNNNSGSFQQNLLPYIKDGGGSFVFNGVSGYVLPKSSSLYDLQVSGAISIWAKTDRDFPSDTTSTSYRGIIAKSRGGGGDDVSYWIDWYGTNTTRILRATIYDVSAGGYSFSFSFDFKKTWHNFCFSFDGSFVTLFINGTLFSFIPQTINAQIIGDAPLNIGRAFLGQYWEGLIGPVQLYNRGLSYSEIQQNYNALKGRFGLS